MAIYFFGAGDRITRTSGSMLSGASDFTIMLWGRIDPITPSGGLQRMLYRMLDAGGTKQVFIGSSVNADTLLVKLSNGVDPDATLTGSAFTYSLFYHIAVVYNATTHVMTVYVNGTSIGTLTLNLSTVTFTREYLSNDGSGFFARDSVAFFRSWQAALSSGEILTETASQQAVRSSGLFMDTPLPTTGFYSDLSGNSRSWAPTGSPQTPFPNFTVSPTPSPVTTIPSLPFTQAVDLSSATTFTTPPQCTVTNSAPTSYNIGWWKYVVPANCIFIFVAAGPSVGADGSWAPSTSIWKELFSGTFIPYIFPQQNGTDQDFCGENWGNNGGGWFRVPTTPGDTLYIQINSGNNTQFLSGALVTLELQYAPTNPIPPGAMVISDDTDGFPAAVIDPTTGTYYAYVTFPAGEFTDTQPTGEMATQDGTGDATVAFLDSALNIVATWSAPAGQFIHGIKSDRNGQFYVVTLDSGTSVSRVRVFNATGTLLSTHSLPSDFDNTRVYAVARDGIKWFAQQTGAGGNILHVYNLQTDTQLADLPISTSHTFTGFGDGYVAADGSLVFAKNTPAIERYDPSTGALIQSYSLTTITGINHFSFGDDSPGSFIVWGYIGFGIVAYFERIALSGTHLSTVGPFQVAAGSNQNAGLADPNAISNSCPLFATTVTITPPVPPSPPSPPPIPPSPPTPALPTVECTPTVLRGATQGEAGCKEPGNSREPITNFTVFGNGNVHPDVSTGESMLNNKGIDIWMALTLRSFVTGITTTYNRALTDLADLPSYYGGLKSNGLLNIGEINHGYGNTSSTFANSSVNIALSEANLRWIRTILDTDDEIEGAWITVYAATKAQRDAGGAPRVLLRGIVNSPLLESPMQVQLVAADPIYALFGPDGQYPAWPYYTLGNIFDKAPEDVKKIPAGPCYGPKTDRGAINPVTGKLAEVGMVPWRWVGTYNAPGSAISLPSTIDGSIGFVTNTGVLGSSGGGWTSDGTVTNDPYHAVVRVRSGVMGPFTMGRAATPSPSGTIYSFRHVWNDPDGSADYYISFQIPVGYESWNPTLPVPTGAKIRYQILKPPPTNPFFDWNYIVTWLTPDSGSAWGTTAGSGTDWDLYWICAGAIKMGGGVFGSDLGGGDPTATPDRVRLAMSEHNGSDILYPWKDDGSVDPAWTSIIGSNTFLDIAGSDGHTYRGTFGMARGPISDAHKTGKINLTSNIVGGIEDVGDGTGNPIFTVGDAFIHLMENFWFNRYRAGNWCTSAGGDFPKWPDGTPMVKTSDFHNFQTYTKTAIGAVGLGLGLEISWFVDEAKSIPQWVSDFNLTTGWDVGETAIGQVGCGYIDQFADPTTWPRISSIIHGFGKLTQQHGQNRVNYMDISGDWHPDFRKFRYVGPTVTNEAAIARYHDYRKNDKPLESKIMENPLHLQWVGQNRVNLFGPGLTVVTFPGKIDLLDYDVDSPGLQLTAIEGTGASGFVDRPMSIRRQGFKIKDRTVTDVFWDIRDVLIATKYAGGLAAVPYATDTSGSAPKITDTTADASLIIT